LDPRDLTLVRRWIELNRDTILAYWSGDLFTDEAIARLVALMRRTMQVLTASETGIAGADSP
jgi:hypothetical protein